LRRSLLRVRKLRVGARTTIGFGNVLRGLRLAEFGEETEGGRATTSGQTLPLQDRGRAGSGRRLKVGNVVFISKRHVIDRSGGVLSDDWSGLAGRGVFIYSHSYDPEFATMTCAPTRIGKNCMVAAMTTLAMGSTLPDASILAMGGVLMPGAVKTYSIYGGVPAKPLSTDIKGWKYLNRTQMTPSNKKGQACPRRRCRRRTDSPHRLTHRFDRD
jgi:acetyltransferase-like isoleucine patch superfamily enzyme